MPQVPCPSCKDPRTGQPTGVISNARTGSPELCPNCQGTLVTSGTYQDLPFWYPISASGVASPTGSVTITLANGNVGGQVTIDNDSDFEVRRFIASSTGLFSVTLKDNKTNRPLTPSPVTTAGFINGENFAGTAQLPFIIEKPFLILRTSTVSAGFTDRSGAPGNVIQLCLWGYKIA